MGPVLCLGMGRCPRFNMTYIFSKTTPSTNGVAIFTLKEHLKSAGWVVKSSGDATTYNSTADQITSGASGAGGFGNNNAWVRIQAPDGYQEFILQRTGTTTIIIKYSRLDHFIGGSPSATVVPTATDEVSVHPSSSFYLFDGTFRYFICADNEFPYTFWSGTYPIGRNSFGTSSGFLALEYFLAGHPDDGNLYMIIKASASTNPFGIGIGSTTDETRTSASALRSITTVASTTPSIYVDMGGASYSLGSATHVYPDNGTSNPISGRDEVIPILWARSSFRDNPGYKGIGSMVKWTGTPHLIGHTLSIESERDQIVWGSASLPWDGSIPII